MVARVTHYHVRPGKVEEFITTITALTSALDQVKGFRLLLVLRGEDPKSREVTSISIWDSPEDVRNSDSDARYYNAISRLIGCCESFDLMHGHEVLMAKFANP